MEKVEDNRSINSSLTCKPHNVDMKRYKMIPYQGQNTWVLIIVVPWSKIFLNHIHIYCALAIEKYRSWECEGSRIWNCNLFPRPWSKLRMINHTRKLVRNINKCCVFEVFSRITKLTMHLKSFITRLKRIEKSKYGQENTTRHQQRMTWNIYIAILEG